MFSKFIDKLYPVFFSETKKAQFEKIIFIVAITVFIINIIFITMVNNGFIAEYVRGYSGVKLNILSAIYTPFSIILFFEIYLLIYYLPKSITIYLAKQYEVVALILIRKIFDELAKLPLGNDDFTILDMSTLFFVFVGLIGILLLIFGFYKLSGAIKIQRKVPNESRNRNFVLIKKILAILLMLVFLYYLITHFIHFSDFKSFSVNNVIYVIKKTTNALFNTFFTALILIEVLLLLFTFDLTESFSKIIRNSGFIISTILLKLSFRAEGLTNVAIILVAVAFGLAILWVYKLFEQKL